MNEIWKSIVGFEDYYIISNLGNIKSNGKTYIDSLGRVMCRKPRNVNVRIGSIGYLCVDLNANGISVQKHIHRLIAEAFIPNPENKATVNHKDGNKLNNALDNLEWATYSENNKHAVDVLFRKSPWKDKLGIDNPNSKIVEQYDKSDNFISEFYGCHEANRITGVNYRHISKCCLGERKSAGGYKWRYKV